MNGELLEVAVLSHHEPVFLGGVGEEPLHRFLGQYLAIDQAGSVDELRAAVREHQGIPWMNTIAADDQGHYDGGHSQSGPADGFFLVAGYQRDRQRGQGRQKNYH